MKIECKLNDEIDSRLTRGARAAGCGKSNHKRQKRPNNDRKMSSFRSNFRLFWVKTTSLSGHHSRFGTTYSGETIKVTKSPIDDCFWVYYAAHLLTAPGTRIRLRLSSHTQR